jgi:phage shock protein C
MPKRLFRSKNEKMIAGVCGGLALYFNIDPVIIRIMAVAFVFAGGAGVLVYVLLWVIVPYEDDITPSAPTPPKP